jgi:hypothetical protein
VLDEFLNATALWDMPRVTSLAHVHITPPTGGIPLDQNFVAEVVGQSTDGSPMAVRAVQWSSSDTSIAIIDDGGRIQPKRVGRFTVHVSAGGWVSDSARMVIGDPKATLLWRADWAPHSDGWRQSKLFGNPQPVPYRDARGWSFFNRGDGSYSSGAYSLMAWPLSEGLSLETSVRLPRTHPVWQSITLGLSSSLDDPRFATWDHHTAGPPFDGAAASCTTSIPASEGAAGVATVGVATETESRIVTAPVAVTRGDWVRVRLDVLADGSCVLTIDGKRLGMARGIAKPTLRRFVTYGQSKATNALVGPVEIWSGVRGAIISAALRR